jgi:hypothetical protein
MTTNEFYERLTPFYPLVYPDWNQSVQHQAAQLEAVIKAHWGNTCRTILDASCGIGTQAIGLAQRQ